MHPMFKRYMYLVVLILIISGKTALAGNPYKIDPDLVDHYFEAGQEVEFSINFQDERVIKDKNPWIAFALCGVAYVTGITGMHRAYLGAGPLIFFAYFCTGGGFAILQTVDAVLLLIAAIEDKTSSPYAYNKKLIMW